MANSDKEEVADVVTEREVLGDEGGDYIEFRVAVDKQHTWRRKAQNHEIISRGESHPRLDEARRAARRANQPIWSLVSDEDLYDAIVDRAEKSEAFHEMLIKRGFVS